MKLRNRVVSATSLALVLSVAAVTAASAAIYSSSHTTLQSLPTIGTTYTHRGDVVALWQNVLYTDYELDLCVSTNPSTAIDGYFGNNTKAATMRWQAARGLTADGIVGRHTWNKMWANTVYGGYDANYNEKWWYYNGQRLGPGQHFLGFTRKLNSNEYYWTFNNLSNPNGGFDTKVQWTGISIYTC